MLPVEQKKQIVDQFKKHATDTGSCEVQIGLLSKNISAMTEHFKLHPKDNASRMGLFRMVDKRRKLLKYLKANSFERYNTVLSALGLRK